jgi:hypothetical protein
MSISHIEPHLLATLFPMREPLTFSLEKEKISKKKSLDAYRIRKGDQ